MIRRCRTSFTADNNDAAFLDIESEDPPLPFNITALIDIDAPNATTEQIAALHAYADKNCPLTKLIRMPNELTIVTGPHT